MNRRFYVLGKRSIRKIFIHIVFLLLIGPLLSSIIPFSAGAVENTNLAKANLAINQAFDNVLIAEEFGANVSHLLVRLNDASELLSRAENYYRSGIIANVSSMADNAHSIAEQVNIDALSLQEINITLSRDLFIQSVIFSSVGSIAFTLLLIYIWRRFKSAYLKKILNLKPEGVQKNA